MTRSEKRRNEREENKKKSVYNFTQEQLNEIIEKRIASEIDKAKKEATEAAINKAMTLLFVLPMEVLMDYYWTEETEYTEKIPEFTEHVLEYYQMWQRDELDMDKMEEDLWTYGGIKFVEEEIK